MPQPSLPTTYTEFKVFSMHAWRTIQAIARKFANSITLKSLRQLRPFKRKRQPNPLLDLPIEIILEILDFLPAASAISFCLTCRSFKGTFSGSQQHYLTEAESKRQLLYLLEHDLPKYIHCSTCNKLYIWGEDAFCYYACSNKRRLSNPGSHPGSTRLCTGHRFNSLEIQLRDLVLRAHERGPKWGLQLSILQWQGHESAGSPGPLFIQFDAKVVEKKLIIKRIDSLVVDLRKAIFTEVQLLTKHYASHNCAGWCVPTIALYAIHNLLESRTPDHPVPEDSSFSTMMPHCTDCATDLKVVAAPGPDREDTFRIDVVSYQDYGNRYVDVNSPQADMFAWSVRSRKHEQAALCRDIESI